MSAYTMYLKIAALAALIAAIFYSGWNLGSDRVQHRWDKQKLELEEASRKDAEANQKRINDLEKVKNENLKTIDNLRGDVAGLRVRLPKTPCAKPNTTGGSGDATTSNGEPVDTTQAAFDNFKRGLESDAENADKIIENCRVVIDWAKKLNTQN